MKKPTLREIAVPTKATLRWWIDTYFAPYAKGTIVDHLHYQMTRRFEEGEYLMQDPEKMKRDAPTKGIDEKRLEEYMFRYGNATIHEGMKDVDRRLSVLEDTVNRVCRLLLRILDEEG